VGTEDETAAELNEQLFWSRSGSWELKRRVYQDHFHVLERKVKRGSLAVTCYRRLKSKHIKLSTDPFRS